VLRVVQGAVQEVPSVMMNNTRVRRPPYLDLGTASATLAVAGQWNPNDVPRASALRHDRHSRLLVRARSGPSVTARASRKGKVKGRDDEKGNMMLGRRKETLAIYTRCWQLLGLSWPHSCRSPDHHKRQARPPRISTRSKPLTTHRQLWRREYHM
jgi:hypothetical protein